MTNLNTEVSKNVLNYTSNLSRLIEYTNSKLLYINSIHKLLNINITCVSFYL